MRHGRRQKSHARALRKTARNIRRKQLGAVSRKLLLHAGFLIDTGIKSRNFAGQEGGRPSVLRTRRIIPRRGTPRKISHARHARELLVYVRPIYTICGQERERERAARFSRISRGLVVVSRARPEEIPLRAVLVALYFIFMQKRQITSRRDAVRLADQKPASGTFDPLYTGESGETRAAVGIGNVQHTRERAIISYGIFSASLPTLLGVPVCEMTTRNRAVHSRRSVRGR